MPIDLGEVPTTALRKKLNDARYIIIVSQSPVRLLCVSQSRAKAREKMTWPIADSHDPDFVYAAHQASHPSPQRPSHSNSDVESIENYDYNRTREGSEADLFRGLNSYRVSGTRDHEFKTYLLDGKLVALPICSPLQLFEHH